MSRADRSEREETESLLVVRTNVTADMEDDFNDWYTNDHLPAIVAVPGIEWGRRYRLIRDHPIYPSRPGAQTYLAIYGMSSPNVPASAEFQSSRGWSPTLRDRVRDDEVAMYALIAAIAKHRE